MEPKKALDPIHSLSSKLKLDLSVLVVQAALLVPLVLKDSKEYAVKLVRLVQLALQEAADPEVSLVYLAKMSVIYLFFFLWPLNNIFSNNNLK